MRKGINTTLRKMGCCRVHRSTDQEGLCPCSCSCALAWALGQHLPRPAQELDELHPSHCFTFFKCFHGLTLSAQYQKPSTIVKKTIEEKKCWQAGRPNKVGIKCLSRKVLHYRSSRSLLLSSSEVSRHSINLPAL